MRQLNISLSIQEYKETGFILKDITDIQNLGFESALSDISSEWLRVNDIVFLDFITYNKIDKASTEYFVHSIDSLQDYRKYNIEYMSKNDGWYTISHLVIPKLTWYIKVKDSLNNGTHYFYDADNQTFVKVVKDGIEFETTYISDPYLIYIALENPNILGVEEDIFILGRIEKCFQDKIKAILYGNLYTKCQTSKNRDSIFRDRDIIWMTLELLKYLIRYCKYNEAQRILEMVDKCNGFCNEASIDKYKFNKGCNCG